MLKLIIYKKKACIYIVGGTKEPITTFTKYVEYPAISNTLGFILSPIFWNSYEGLIHKGVKYRVNNLKETSELIEKLIKGEN